ncbi:MAG: uracil-DNA glycosylase [Planctomycetota bacterium]
MPVEERVKQLTVLDQTHVTGCTKCVLHETRTQTVFGEGAPDARLMFIGEGPGQNEDETGRPFVGRAGQLLDKMIDAMGLSRESVFIANVVKCRPPNNRQPTADETAACTPYLLEQVQLVRPEVIVTLGLPASRYMLNSSLSMGKLRGRWHTWRGIQLMPTYHPAYVLRSYNEKTRRTVWGDLQMVMEALGLQLPSSS